MNFGAKICVKIEKGVPVSGLIGPETGAKNGVPIAYQIKCWFHERGILNLFVVLAESIVVVYPVEGVVPTCHGPGGGGPGVPGLPGGQGLQGRRPAGVVMTTA